MSATYGLVKFKTTGNIYMCCYEGTSDIMIPFIFKPEECYTKDGYNVISYGRELAKKNNWDIPKVSDVDEIEIYSDYGGGFYWQGKGSESLKVITSGYDFDEDVHDYEDGRPEWVSVFWETLRETNVRRKKRCL